MSHPHLRVAGRVDGILPIERRFMNGQQPFLTLRNAEATRILCLPGPDFESHGNPGLRRMGGRRQRGCKRRRSKGHSDSGSPLWRHLQFDLLQPGLLHLAPRIILHLNLPFLGRNPQGRNNTVIGLLLNRQGFGGGLLLVRPFGFGR